MNRIEFDRPSWNDYFLGIAKVISLKSHDAQTKHGCVIVSEDNNILGTGYNGFPRGIDDSLLPNIRPSKDIRQDSVDYKYPWMLHSERNALANCVLQPKNATAYVTGQCCNECIMALWQSGIIRVFMIPSHGSFLLYDDNAKAIWDKFIDVTKMEINYVTPNLSWLNQVQTK